MTVSPDAPLPSRSATAGPDPTLAAVDPTLTGTPSRAVQDRSIGEVMGDISRDLSTLMRQEVALAKAEISDSASKAGKATGLLAGAATAAFLTLLFLSVALWWALGTAIGLGWSALVVALLWAVVGAILAVTGRSELSRVRGLPKTAETMSKIPNALKGNEEENR
jgi:hypothetical protein